MSCARCGQPFTRGEYPRRGICYTCKPKHSNPPKPRLRKLHAPVPTVLEWAEHTQFEDEPIAARLEKTK